MGLVSRPKVTGSQEGGRKAGPTRGGEHHPNHGVVFSKTGKGVKGRNEKKKKKSFTNSAKRLSGVKKEEKGVSDMCEWVDTTKGVGTRGGEDKVKYALYTYQKTVGMGQGTPSSQGSSLGRKKKGHWVEFRASPCHLHGCLKGQKTPGGAKHKQKEETRELTHVERLPQTQTGKEENGPCGQTSQHSLLETERTFLPGKGKETKRKGSIRSHRSSKSWHKKKPDNHPPETYTRGYY